MASTSGMPNSRKTNVVFVLGHPVVCRSSQLLYYIRALCDHHSEGNCLHQIRIESVTECNSSVPFFCDVGKHDGVESIPPDGNITGKFPDGAVFDNYRPIIKMIDNFQKTNKQDPNMFLYHLCHIAVGYHDVTQYPVLGASPKTWDPNWKLVRDELTSLNINLSIILIDPCVINPYPEFRQSFFEISCTRTPPQLYASPYDAILLSGFRPVSELGESLTNSLVQGTQYITNDQSLGAPTLHYMQVPATDPVLDPNEGPQVPGAPGLDSMFWSGGGVEQSMLHDHREELGWTGTLCLNGVRVHARALAIEAARNPKLRAWPKDLRLEKVADPIPTLDIQAWILKKKVPVVRVGSIDGTDNWNFKHLTGAVRNGGGYAIVKWENRGVTLERLLLVPVGDILLCAAFPDGGIPERPKRQEPRLIRVLKQGKRSQGKGKSRAEPSVTMPTSTEGPCGEAAQSTTIPPKLQSVPEGAYFAQDVEESTQGDSNPSNSLYQEDVLAQNQEMSSDEMDIDEEPGEEPDEEVDEEEEEELNDWQTDADCESDSSDI